MDTCLPDIPAIGLVIKQQVVGLGKDDWRVLEPWVITSAIKEKASI